MFTNTYVNINPDQVNQLFEKKIAQNKCSYALRKTTRLNFIGAINEVKKMKSAENKLK